MKLVNYVKDAFNELKNKVTWPTWAELQNSAVIVMVATLIISLFVLVMDLGFKELMKILYSLFY